jgi:two-component system chemotaxis response regulator CheB
VFAQDERSSVVWGMPGAVTGAGLAHRVLPLDQVAQNIVGVAQHATGSAAAARAVGGAA